MSELMTEIQQGIYRGDAKGVVEIVERALAEDVPARRILDEGLLRGMDAVGRDFQAGELFLPEIIVAARAMHAALALVQPRLLASAAEGGPAQTSGKVLLCTVQGDLHDIGKKIVGIMLQGAGFEVVDLGCDVSAEQLVAAAREHGPDIVGLSALLSTTMPMMRSAIEAFRGDAELGRMKVMVGGAPVTQAWADEVGADGYARDAVGAADRARELLAARGPNAQGR